LRSVFPTLEDVFRGSRRVLLAMISVHPFFPSQGGRFPPPLNSSSPLALYFPTGVLSVPYQIFFPSRFFFSAFAFPSLGTDFLPRSPFSPSLFFFRGVSSSPPLLGTTQVPATSFSCCRVLLLSWVGLKTIRYPFPLPPTGWVCSSFFPVS